MIATLTSGGDPTEQRAPPLATSSGTEASATGTDTHHKPALFLTRTPPQAMGSLGAANLASSLAWAKDLNPTQATNPEMETLEDRSVKAEEPNLQATLET